MGFGWGVFLGGGEGGVSGGLRMLWARGGGGKVLWMEYLFHSRSSQNV